MIKSSYYYRRTESELRLDTYSCIFTVNAQVDTGHNAYRVPSLEVSQYGFTSKELIRHTTHFLF